MPTELVTIFYNGHFTQMCYPDKVQEQLDKWALPIENIELVQYPAGSVVAPFNVGAAKEIYILQEELPPPPVEDPPVLYSFKTSLKEILSTSAGKKFANLIRENNKKLLDAGLDVVVVEPLSEESEEPEYYSITATIQPTGV